MPGTEYYRNTCYYYCFRQSTFCFKGFDFRDVNPSSAIFTFTFPPQFDSMFDTGLWFKAVPLVDFLC